MRYTGKLAISRPELDETMLTTIKTSLKTIPVLGPLAKQLYFRFLAPSVASSAEYWESRYRSDGHSGAGSHDRLAQFKAEILNEFVRSHAVDSVVEFGCGDGRQLALADYPAYLGIDVSPTALEQCRARFAGDPSKHFVQSGEQPDRTFDLALSLDVIYHLIEDEVFEAYMRTLFDAAHRWAIIYSSNSDAPTPEPHIQHRRVTDWVATHRKDWRLVEQIGNRYPYDSRNPDLTSFADFYIYERVEPVRA